MNKFITIALAIVLSPILLPLVIVFYFYDKYVEDNHIIEKELRKYDKDVNVAVTPILENGNIMAQTIPTYVKENLFVMKQEVNKHKEITVEISTYGIVVYMIKHFCLFNNAVKSIIQHELTHVKQIRYLQKCYPDIWYDIITELNTNAYNLRLTGKIQSKKGIKEYTSQPLEISATRSEYDYDYFINYDPAADNNLNQN